MKIEGKRLHKLIDEGESLHVETTLAGKGNAQSKLIDRAHENGFEVTLLYVSLSSPDIAIKRVEERVSKGGHGVNHNLIRKRYEQSLNNLPKLINKVDNVNIFDNSKDVLTLIYGKEGKKVLFNDLDKYPYIKM